MRSKDWKRRPRTTNRPTRKEFLAAQRRFRLPRMGPINSVYLARLYEVPQTAVTLAKAIALIESSDDSKPIAPFTRYEVGVRYNNGNEVRGQFTDKTAAIAFLRGMR